MTRRLGAIPDEMEQNMQSVTRQERYSRSLPKSQSSYPRDFPEWRFRWNATSRPFPPPADLPLATFRRPPPGASGPPRSRSGARKAIGTFQPGNAGVAPRPERA
jgi:hypothetical protein